MPLFAARHSGSKRLYWLAPLILLGGFVALAKATNTNPPTNSARTSANDSDLQTRIYKASPDLAAKTIASLSLSTYGRAWKLKSQTRVSPDEIELVFDVPVVVFTDVLTVSVRNRHSDSSDNEVEVNVESHSQVGKGDFGENRRHVLQMLAELDKTLG